MVDTILSDKTGTLTCNMMEFFKASIAGVSYGQGVTEIEKANARRSDSYHVITLSTIPSFILTVLVCVCCKVGSSAETLVARLVPDAVCLVLPLLSPAPSGPMPCSAPAIVFARASHTL